MEQRRCRHRDAVARLDDLLAHKRHVDPDGERDDGPHDRADRLELASVPEVEAEHRLGEERAEEHGLGGLLHELEEPEAEEHDDGDDAEGDARVQ